MKKTILLFLAGAFVTANVYSQCACCAGAGTGSSNGDFNNGILTLAPKQFVMETYADYRTVSDGHEHHSHSAIDTSSEEETPLESMLINSVGMRYGITDGITVSALLPYVFLHTASGNDHGVGDLVLLGTFRLINRNDFNLALQAGAELPTGVHKGSNFDNTTVVLGSGSFDPMAGVVLSKTWDKLSLLGNALYKYTTTGFENNYYGSLSVHSASVMYRIKGENMVCNPDTNVLKANPGFGLSVSGGYYGEWLDKIKEKGEVDDNSGYYMGFATMGTTLSYKKWSLPLTLSLPIAHHMNGTQNDDGFRVRMGLIRVF